MLYTLNLQSKDFHRPSSINPYECLSAPSFMKYFVGWLFVSFYLYMCDSSNSVSWQAFDISNIDIYI